jgi:hypothetical protein
MQSNRLEECIALADHSFSCVFSSCLNQYWFDLARALDHENFLPEFFFAICF